jgi:hypothetical protein
MIGFVKNTGQACDTGACPSERSNADRMGYRVGPARRLRRQRARRHEGRRRARPRREPLQTTTIARTVASSNLLQQFLKMDDFLTRTNLMFPVCSSLANRNVPPAVEGGTVYFAELQTSFSGTLPKAKGLRNTAPLTLRLGVGSLSNCQATARNAPSTALRAVPLPVSLTLHSGGKRRRRFPPCASARGRGTMQSMVEGALAQCRTPWELVL